MGGRFFSFWTVPGNSFLRSPGTCLPGLTKPRFLQLWILASNITLQVCGGYCMRSEHRKKRVAEMASECHWCLFSLQRTQETKFFLFIIDALWLGSWRPVEKWNVELDKHLRSLRRIHMKCLGRGAFCYPCLTTPLNPPLATGCQLQRDHSLAPADRPAEVSARTERPEKLP